MTGEGPEQTEAPAIITELNGAEALIRINHPARRNALSTTTTLQELDAAVSAIIALSSISTIILTGTGDVFSSGANIHEIQSLTPTTAKEFARHGQRLFQKIANVPQQAIAAINGYCMGGGLDLALACDFRCASHKAVFAHPGAQLGIITGWGGTRASSAPYRRSAGAGNFHDCPPHFKPRSAGNRSGGPAWRFGD